MLNEVLGHETDEDLYPSTEDQHKRLIRTFQEEFRSAESAAQGHHDRFDRYYKHYRSYRGVRKTGEYRSMVFMPVTFYVIETILPRMVAQMPRPIVSPVGPEDVPGARKMEDAVGWCFDQAEAFVQVMLGFKDALMYGTGILKTFHGQVRGRRFVFERPQVPIMQQVPMPVPDPEGGGAPLMGIDGEPVTEMVEMMLGMEQGEPVRRFEEAVSYSGPATQIIDPKNFFPAPGATSVKDARYVIERAWRDKEWVLQQVADGVYRIPEGYSIEAFTTVLDDPAHNRLTSIGLDGGVGADEARQMVEVWERWSDETVTHILGGQVIVRRTRNPFSHSEKPYVPIWDHKVPHEFWGVGEVEAIEGLQDVFNALTNSRIDQIKLSLDSPFLVDEAALKDRRELTMRPGGVVRVVNNWGLPLEQVIQKVTFGDVPTSSFEETATILDMIERTSGVSDYQLGTESGRRNDTATGVAIISEQGNTRLSHKLKVAELTGLRTLARHFGTNLQQFMPEEMRYRIFNPGPGEDPFGTIRPEELQGAFDYDIESESSTITESVRKEQDLSLFDLFAADPLIDPYWIRERVLRSWGVKDIDAALPPQGPMGMGAGMDPMAAALGLPGAAPNGLPPAAPPMQEGMV